MTFETVADGWSVSLGAIFPLWIACMALAADVGVNALASVMLFGTFLILWILVLLVAAATPTPPRLADASILVNHLTWLLRAVWGSFVLAVSAVFSSVVAIELTKKSNFSNPDSRAVQHVLLEAVGALAGPVAIFGTMLASIALPIQLQRAGAEARAASVVRLLRPLHEGGLPTAWLARLLLEASTFWVGLLVCYFGPVIAFALVTMAPELLG